MPTRTPPHVADVRDVERLAASMSDEHLECRTYGHTWRPLRATWHSKFRYYYTIQLCSRCDTERHAELTERGHVTAAWYRYPDGYLAKNLGRVSGEGRDVMRLATMGRIYALSTVRSNDKTPHSRSTRQSLGMEE